MVNLKLLKKRVGLDLVANIQLPVKKRRKIVVNSSEMWVCVGRRAAGAPFANVRVGGWYHGPTWTLLFSTLTHTLAHIRPDTFTLETLLHILPNTLKERFPNMTCIDQGTLTRSFYHSMLHTYKPK